MFWVVAFFTTVVVLSGLGYSFMNHYVARVSGIAKLYENRMQKHYTTLNTLSAQVQDQPKAVAQARQTVRAIQTMLEEYEALNRVIQQFDAWLAPQRMFLGMAPDVRTNLRMTLRENVNQCKALSKARDDLKRVLSNGR